MENSIYRKQQKLSSRKPSRFLWIFDESQKFSLPIDRRRFSQHFHKSYRTAKLFSSLTFVVYDIYLFIYMCVCVTPEFNSFKQQGAAHKGFAMLVDQTLRILSHHVNLIIKASRKDKICNYVCIICDFYHVDFSCNLHMIYQLCFLKLCIHIFLSSGTCPI